MIKIKTYKEYEKEASGNVETFSNGVSILTNETLDVSSPFNVITDISEVNQSSTRPILIWNNSKFKNDTISLNENENSRFFFYNSNIKPVRGRLFSNFIGENFIPKTVRSRNKVKGLKFPIVAMNNKFKENSIYSSYDKFQESENHYTVYQEKVNPKTRYRATYFKDNLVALSEVVNDETFIPSKRKEINLRGQLNEIASKVNSVYPRDVYSLTIYETKNGNLYLNSMNHGFKMNEREMNNLYVHLYEDFYDTKLPMWFKNKIRK